MRIKIYIVTFRNNALLDRCLESIFSSPDFEKFQPKVCVLNNHTEGKIRDDYVSKVTMIQNQASPDFGKGHLARSWNQCLLHGFKDIQNPNADLVILVQNDAVFQPNFLTAIVEQISRFDYISVGVGDEIQVITTEGLKKVGMHDERYCNIGFQEADYFVKARCLLGDRASINDTPHRRVHNPIDISKIKVQVPHGCARQDAHAMESMRYHVLSRNIFRRKYGNLDPENWDAPSYDCSNLDFRQEIFYPYFECNLPDLNKKYFV